MFNLTSLYWMSDMENKWVGGWMDVYLKYSRTKQIGTWWELDSILTF